MVWWPFLHLAGRAARRRGRARRDQGWGRCVSIPGSHAVITDPPEALVMIGKDQAAVGGDRRVDQREVNPATIGVPRPWLGLGHRFHGRVPSGPLSPWEE